MRGRAGGSAMSGRARVTLAIILVSTLSTCGTGASGELDGGSRADAGDSGADVGIPDSSVRVDAGPWEAAFEPRLIIDHPDVTCAPFPARTYAGPARPPAAPGTVRWTYRPSRDPDPEVQAQFRSWGLRAVSFSNLPFTVTPEGGVIAVLGEGAHLLAFTPDGGFDWIRRGMLWRGPTTLLTTNRLLVPTGAGNFFVWSLDGPEPFGEEPIRGVTLMTEVPGAQTVATEAATPAVLGDGTLVFAGTDRLIVASCADGRLRWALEHDIPPEGAFTPRFYAHGDGESVVAVVPGSVMRIASTGEVLVRARLEPRSGFVLGYGDACGVGWQTVTPTRPGGLEGELDGLGYLRPPDYELVSVVPHAGAAGLCRDCGGWYARRVGGALEYRRRRADGSEIVHRPSPGGMFTSMTHDGPIELADGNWLFVSAVEPSVAVVSEETGEELWRTALDPAVVGEVLVWDAYALTPDGTLYVVGSDMLADVQRLVAIEIGVGPREPGMTAGLTWMRDNAAW